MAGTLTVTTADKGGRVNEYQMAWAGATVNTNNFCMAPGRLLTVKFKPDACCAPTACYDVTLNGPCCVDLLGGAGANLSASCATRATIKQSCLAEPYFEGGSVDLCVTNAGACGKGTVTVYVQRQ